MAVQIGAIVKGAKKAKDIKGKADNVKDNIKEKTGLNGGVSDESREQEAEKSGKETISHETKKTINTIIKIKTALAFILSNFLVFAKILMIATLVIAVLSLFGINIDNDSSPGGYTAGAVGTTTPDTDMTVTPEGGEGLEIGEIESFIDNFESADDTLKTELKNSAEDIQKWQNDNGYDARILIALTFNEADGAPEFDVNEFITIDMTNSANTWKEQGLTTIEEVVTQYICEQHGVEPEDMTSLQILTVNMIVNSIGIAEQASGISGEQEVSGDGYFDEYTNLNGFTFKNYKQNEGTYKDHYWTQYQGTKKTISQCGCGLTATAIILSGLTGVDRTPLELLQDEYGEAGYIADGFSRAAIFANYGFSMNGYMTSNIDSVLDELKKGNVAMIDVGADSDFTNDQHYMAILDYNEARSEVYLSDPFNSISNPDGWISWEKVKKGWKGYNVVKVPKRSQATTTPSNAIGVMDNSTYNNAVDSTSFASTNLKTDNAFSSGADILTDAGCDGKVVSYIAISNKGEFIKYNTSKEMNYESIIKLPTIYSIAAHNSTATDDIKNDNDLDERSITFDEETKVLQKRPITGCIADTLIDSDNYEYSRLCQEYIGQSTFYNTDIVKWLRNPDNTDGLSGDYYGATADYGTRSPQDVLMGGAVWGSGTILRPIRWMYAIATNELNVDKDVYNIIMNYASQCATPSSMTAKSGHTIYQKTGSGVTIHGHDIGIVVNDTTKDFYIYAIMLENDSNDKKVCPKIADAIFNVMKDYID